MALFQPIIQRLLKEKPLMRTYDIVLKRSFKKQSTSSPRLAEIGKFVSVKDSKYEAGQMFLHRVFGYRGVILFPWTARVYDRDSEASGKQAAASLSGNAKESEAQTAPEASGDDSVWNSQKSESNQGVQNATENTTKGKEQTQAEQKELRGKAQTFYQVLMDARDCPHIRAQTEAVTFLGTQDASRGLYAIPGLDYVAHEDIMPYNSVEKRPLKHELFDKLLVSAPDNDPPFAAQDTLRAWQKASHPRLEKSDVHRETTENVRVTVMPFYMGNRETQTASVYWWRYCIRIENLGEQTVQLRERHWRIFSLSGTLETVRGRGVVGQEPILSPRLPAFQYSSHVSLQAPSGHMWGTFRMEREDGYSFDCKIPPFSLDSKAEESRTPPPMTPPTYKSDL